MPSCCQSEPGCVEKRRYNAVYHPTPSAPPLLEININQHNPSSNSYSTTPLVSPSSAVLLKEARRPPDFPPPPPPSNAKKEGHYSNPGYHLPRPPDVARNRRTSLRQLGRNASMRAANLGRRLYKKQNRTQFRVCLVELTLSVLLLSAGVLCVWEAHHFCPFYSALWTSAFFLLTAIVGLAAAKVDTPNLYVALLVLSLVSVLLALAGNWLAALNWSRIGTYDPTRPQHPIVGRDRLFCLLGEHDPKRLSHIFNNMHDPNYFPECLLQLKVGIAVETVQILTTTVLALLFLVSAFLCIRRILAETDSSGGHS